MAKPVHLRHGLTGVIVDDTYPLPVKGVGATIGSAAPTTGQLIAGSDGTSARAAKTDAGGRFVMVGHGFDVPVIPAVTNGAYSAGDIVGALMEFDNLAPENDAPILVSGAQITCKAAVAPVWSLILLNADPTSTTKTDNAAYSLNAADVQKVIKSLTGFTLFDHGTPNSWSLENIGLICKPATGTKKLYGLLIDGTGVTLTSTADIQVRLRGCGV